MIIRKEFSSYVRLEEMSELSKELLKTSIGKKIIEEIGDLYILLEQLKVVYKINEQEIFEVIDKKLLD